jgi:hypothetical protein
MSIDRYRCCWEQHSIEERTPKCPLADKASLESTLEEGRTGECPWEWQIGLSLGATFKGRT